MTQRPAKFTGERQDIAEIINYHGADQAEDDCQD